MTVDRDAARPMSGALLPLSPDRINQTTAAAGRGGLEPHLRDSHVGDKISQFNSLHSVASASRALERKTHDAALKRAMLGREEAESEMRRFRDEAAALRQQIEDGKLRERRVGERLEAVMENFGRAKETHAHTQALWEKEIRRARKETFKTQSTNVRIQEELKAARSALRLAEDALEREKERSRVREQEAFAARYEIVGVQEQLDQTQECVRVLEQERDALRSLADAEPIAAIAAHGRLPLPPPSFSPERCGLAMTAPEDEPVAPRVRSSSCRLSAADMLTASAATEAEIEDLERLAAWQAQRTRYAFDLAHFLSAECELRCCPCARAQASRTSSAHPRPQPHSSEPDQLDLPRADLVVPPLSSTADLVRYDEPGAAEAVESPIVLSATVRRSNNTRRSTVFYPLEGVFRIVSVPDMSMTTGHDASSCPPTANPSGGRHSPDTQLDPEPELEPEPMPDSEPETELASEPEPRHHVRTPSADPPTFAVRGHDRISLVSLLNAPHTLQPCGPGEHDQTATPTSADHAMLLLPVTPLAQQTAALGGGDDGSAADILTLTPSDASGSDAWSPSSAETGRGPAADGSYATVTTTTTVPLRGDAAPGVGPGRAVRALATAKSFDASNPAMTPTMTREQALAQIHERRGRARSAAQSCASAATPRRALHPDGGSGDRRDISAPANQTYGAPVR